MNKQQQRLSEEKKSELGASAPEKKNLTKKKPSKRRSRGDALLFFALKWTVIFFAIFISIIAGLIFGYSILGDGQASDVFDLNMWKHIFDLVFSQ